MSDYNTPTLTTLYTAVLQALMDRDVDAITLCLAAPSNAPVGTIRWSRGSLIFQEWSGSAFNNLILAIAGGGTGSSSASGARTNLGLGSIATQNNNLVSITGGTITGVTLDAATIASGVVALARGGLGASLGLGAAGTFLQVISGAVGFGVDGSLLTGLNASNLASGTVPLARLPASSPTGVIQTVQTLTTTAYTVTGAYAIVPNMLTVIIPTNVNNRVRIQFCTNFFLTWNSGTATRLNVRITRGGTVIHTRQDIGGLSGVIGINIGGINLDYIDSPASVASTLYRMEAQLTGSGSGETCTINGGASSNMATITASEITP